MTRSIAHIALFMIVTAGVASAAVQVSALVDATRPIYADSPFSYSIVVANGSQPESIDLAPLKDFNPGNPRAQQRSTMINGQASSYNILTYELIAPAPGEYTLPAITVMVDGKSYQTNPVTLTVLAAGTAQQIDAQLELSETSCYVGQPVVLTFSFFVWTDIVRSDQIANINFRVPILDSDAFYVEDVDASAPQQQQRPVELAVNGQPQLVEQDQLNHNGVDCLRVRFSKVLIPKQPGDFPIDAATATADLAVAQAAPSRRGMLDSFFGPQYEYKRFSTRTKPLALKVLPLPDSGKPADFYGLVGNYTISASAAPVAVNVGDPITLTIRIGGSPYLKPVQWPNLASVDGFADFKIPAERADGEIQSGRKVFTQTIRAGSDTVKQIPPIPLSFFDAASGKYKTVYSDPIPLDVAPTRTVTGADIESTSPFTSPRRQMESIKEGLSANYTSADALIDQHFHLAAIIAGPAFWTLWAAPAILLIASLLGRAVTNQDPRRLAARRRRAAYSVTLGTIRKISAQNTAAGPELARVLKQYAADKFDKVAGALTAEDVRRLIAEFSLDESLACRFKQIIERAEAAAYSPAGFEFDTACKKEIVSLLHQVESATRSSRPRSLSIRLLLLCLLCLFASQASAAMSRDDLFLAYTRANQNFAQANSQTNADAARKLYEQAILDYESIVEQGPVRNAKLYYNLGNAFLLTDDLGKSILNYRRALLLDSSNPDILKNLAFARSKQLDRIPATAQKKVLERLFFWHYDLSIRTRFVIGGICFAALCLYLSMRLWFVRLPRLLPLCVILTLLAGLMAASVGFETMHNTTYRSGVICAPEVVARQGDGLSYPASFSEPLHAGLEFELIERRPDWLCIRLANGQQTWIPANTADLI